MRMRYAIVSDIHGNLQALEAVLKDIRKRKVDRRLCLYVTEPCKVEIRRVSCDVKAAGKRIRDAGLPEVLADRLEYGRWVPSPLVPRFRVFYDGGPWEEDS